MPNTTAPKGSRYTGFFMDMVNNQLKVYRKGTLVETIANNDVTFADAVTVDDITATTGCVLPAAITIGAIPYTFPGDDGDSGEQLQTNGSGVLTWEASGV